MIDQSIAWILFHHENQVINILCYAFLILTVQFNFEFTTLTDKYIAIYVAQIVVTNFGRVWILWDFRCYAV